MEKSIVFLSYRRGYKEG